MAELAAAVVVLSIVVVLNLIFTLGVVRRLRDHEDRLARIGTGIDSMGALQPPMVAPGSAVHDFITLSVDDEPVSRAGLGGPTLVAFLSTHCSSCEDVVPGLAELAGAFPGGRSNVIVVIVAEDDDERAVGFVERFRPLARVVRDIDGGQLPTAFGLQGFPALGVVDERGVLLSAGYELADVAVPALG